MHLIRLLYAVVGFYLWGHNTQFVTFTCILSFIGLPRFIGVAKGGGRSAKGEGRKATAKDERESGQDLARIWDDRL